MRFHSGDSCIPVPHRGHTGKTKPTYFQQIQPDMPGAAQFHAVAIITVSAASADERQFGDCDASAID